MGKGGGKRERERRGRTIADICGSNCPNLTSTNLRTIGRGKKKKRKEKTRHASLATRMPSIERATTSTRDDPVHLPPSFPRTRRIALSRSLRVAASSRILRGGLLSCAIDDFNLNASEVASRHNGSLSVARCKIRR